MSVEPCEVCHEPQVNPDDAPLCRRCRDFEEWWHSLTPEQQALERAALDRYTAAILRDVRRAGD